MKVRLRDNRIVEVVQFNKNIPTSAFLKFINDIIDEDIYILHNKKYTLGEEEKWKREKLKAIKKNECVGLVALSGKRVVASLEARRERCKLSDNVSCGVAVSRDFRGVGLGERMLRTLIAEAKKKLKPKNIYLTMIAKNKPAFSLYKKVGFRKIIGRHPKWFRHKGRYLDQLTLLLVE